MSILKRRTLVFAVEAIVFVSKISVKIYIITTFMMSGCIFMIRDKTILVIKAILKNIFIIIVDIISMYLRSGLFLS